MRIISGQYGGRLFHPSKSKNWATRPTTDRAKESLYNILANRLQFEEIRMLDLFAGLGNHSFEAISRGCESVVAVEKYKSCVNFIKEVSEELGVKNQLDLRSDEVFRFLKNYHERPFDYIFADPPYALSKLKLLPDIIFKEKILASDGLLVVEHDKSNDFKDHQHFLEERKYGISIFTFFSFSN